MCLLTRSNIWNVVNTTESYITSNRQTHQRPQTSLITVRKLTWTAWSSPVGVCSRMRGCDWRTRWQLTCGCFRGRPRPLRGGWSGGWASSGCGDGSWVPRLLIPVSVHLLLPDSEKGMWAWRPRAQACVLGGDKRGCRLSSGKQERGRLENKDEKARFDVL